jgi:hypothetical protein
MPPAVDEDVNDTDSGGKLASLLSNPAALEQLKSSPEMQSLRTDPQMGAFFSDLDSGGASAAMR